MGVFSHFRLPRFPLVLLVGLLFLKASVASAGLLCDPPSYVVASPDGKYVLVMINPRLPGFDEAKLPDGRTVHLRDEFPASGLYRLGSNEPIWRTEFCGGPKIVSDDGSHWVLCNRLSRPEDTKGLAVRFFDLSGEIKTFAVTDLIDFPLLLEYTASDVLAWIDWEGLRTSNIDNGVFYLRTLTRESYEFDVTTGNILNETHFWRPLARWGLVLLVVLSGMIAWGIYCYGCWCRKYLATMQPSPENASGKISFSFSLRQLLGATTVVAIGCFVYRVAPFVLPLFIALGLTIVLGRRLLFALKECHWYFKPKRFAGLAIGFLVVLLATYVLTIGPVFAMTDYEYDLAGDIRIILWTIYYPALIFLNAISFGSLSGLFSDFFEANRVAWKVCFREWRK